MKGILNRSGAAAKRTAAAAATCIALAAGMTGSPAVAQDVSIMPIESLHVVPTEPHTIQVSPNNYGTAIYDNTVNFNLRTVEVGPNIEVADDIHMDEGGNIVSVRFAYYCLFVFGGTVDVTISIYDNDENNSITPSNGATLLGEYVVRDLPKQLLSLVSVRYDLPEKLSVPKDAWVGITFSSNDVLHVLCDPPVVGSSDDLFHQDPPGNLFFFNGDPKANFWIGLYADGPGVLYLEQADPGIAGQPNTLRASGASPDSTVYFLYATAAGSTPIPACPGVNVDLQAPKIIGTDVADADGNAELTANVPATASGLNVVLQAVEADTCNVSNVQFQTIQ